MVKMFEVAISLLAPLLVLALGAWLGRTVKRTYGIELARWLFGAATLALAVGLLLEFGLPRTHLGLRTGFYLAIACGLLYVLWLGTWASRSLDPTHEAFAGSVIGVGVAAIVIAWAATFLAWMMMWGDLHLDLPGPKG